ncbi:hypothetical protein [Nocardia grenadensis]|uniref:hypothetical protein n=1 Tax=Nocardia grenadensis TaxID=931537 RepID=UPI0007A37CB4|nr:hypothetical protein [Nocardia grenadensis]
MFTRALLHRYTARALALTVAAGCATAFPTPAPSATAAPPEITCGWSPRIGADTFNVAYPDTFANYWMMFVPAAPGTSVTLRGEFPHARYMSFVSYSSGSATGVLTDTAITPDPGSVNPFRTGADRQREGRSYTIRVVVGDRPENPEPNTLYAQATDGVVPVIFRVYRPDAGRDSMGGTGLPRITVRTTGGGAVELADCAASTSDSDPHGIFPKDRPRPGRGQATPLPHAPRWAGREGGGLFPNPDNRYLATLLDSGRTAVVRGRLPETPDTFPGAARMAPGQLRYWSMCSGDGPSTSTLSCLVDDEIPVDENGEFTIVVSAPEHRPDPSCGVAWLPANSGETLLIMRNMLPAADFSGSVQSADPQDPEPVLGPYYPKLTYQADTGETTGPC